MAPIKNLRNMRFGKLVAVEISGRSDTEHRITWLCRCDCGNNVSVTSHNLQRERTLHCGCSPYKKPYEDWTGKRIGKLIVMGREEYNGGRRRVRWICRCDCGQEHIVDSGALKSGDTRSCGCLRGDGLARTHGYAVKDKASSLEYLLWRGGRDRAKDQGLPFNLTPADILVPHKCSVLGLELRRGTGKGGLTDNSPSLDKIIPKRGYVKNNVRVISWKANRIKTDATAQELLKIGFDLLGHTSGRYYGGYRAR